MSAAVCGREGVVVIDVGVADLESGDGEGEGEGEGLGMAESSRRGRKVVDDMLPATPDATCD